MGDVEDFLLFAGNDFALEAAGFFFGHDLRQDVAAPEDGRTPRVKG